VTLGSNLALSKMMPYVLAELIMNQTNNNNRINVY